MDRLLVLVVGPVNDKVPLKDHFFADIGQDFDLGPARFARTAPDISFGDAFLAEMNRPDETQIRRGGQSDFVVDDRDGERVGLGKNMMTARDLRAAEYVFVTDFEDRNTALVELKVDNISDDFFRSQRPHLIVRPFRHQLHPLAEFGNSELHPVETDGLNADFETAGQFAVGYERILVDQLDESLLALTFR